VRHLPRLVEGVSGALQQERLSRGDLCWLQPYQPSLSASWLLQRAMAPKPGQVAAPAAAAPAAAAAAGAQAGSSSSASTGSSGAASSRGGWLPPDHVNRLLRCNFSVLRLLGDRVMRPFLKDTLQLGPLAAMMAGMLLRCSSTMLALLTASLVAVLAVASTLHCLSGPATNLRVLPPALPLALQGSSGDHSGALPGGAHPAARLVPPLCGTGDIHSRARPAVPAAPLGARGPRLALPPLAGRSGVWQRCRLPLPPGHCSSSSTSGGTRSAGSTSAGGGSISISSMLPQPPPGLAARVPHFFCFCTGASGAAPLAGLLPVPCIPLNYCTLHFLTPLLCLCPYIHCLNASASPISHRPASPSLYHHCSPRQPRAMLKTNN
jgi:hypothetical protein